MPLIALCRRLYTALARLVLRLDMAALRFRINEIESDIAWEEGYPNPSRSQLAVYRGELAHLKALLRETEARHARR